VSRTVATLDAVNAEILVRRREVLAAMQEYKAANEDLKHLCDLLESLTHDAMGQIEGGAKSLDMAQSMGLADRRETMNTAGSRMRKARHEFQRAMFLLAVAEGDSRAEIARVWRVSRQLVSRMTGEELDA
jgi:hypothetical protein